MDIRKVIQRRIRHSSGGVNAVADINAVVAGNVNEPGADTHVSSSQSTRIVQRGGETHVFDDTEGDAHEREQA